MKRTWKQLLIDIAKVVISFLAGILTEQNI